MNIWVTDTDTISFHTQSVNDGIKIDTQLDAPFKLVVEFINLTGVGSLVKGSLALTTSRLVAVKEWRKLPSRQNVQES